jgi:hypothetical protein
MQKMNIQLHKITEMTNSITGGKRSSTRIEEHVRPSLQKSSLLDTEASNKHR